ncbi:nucleoside phosphorylase-I family protein [Streptomyces griseofuscus]|uniref:hypothetical protein n=1 Tax=Streptomyces griseofuscus TaxID=146922 RepID=UPI00369824CE
MGSTLVTPFPLHPGKHALPAVTEPAEHARHVRDRYPGATLSSTDGVVLLYQQDVPEKTVNRYRCRRVHRVRGELFILKRRPTRGLRQRPPQRGGSRHYLPPGSHIKAFQQLTYALAASLRAREVDARSGPSWTTDALYRGIDAAAVFAVADSLVERRPRREQPEVASASASACHRP